MAKINRIFDNVQNSLWVLLFVYVALTGYAVSGKNSVLLLTGWFNYQAGQTVLLALASILFVGVLFEHIALNRGGVRTLEFVFPFTLLVVALTANGQTVLVPMGRSKAPFFFSQQMLDEAIMLAIYGLSWNFFFESLTPERLENKSLVQKAWAITKYVICITPLGVPIFFWKESSRFRTWLRTKLGRALPANTINAQGPSLGQRVNRLRQTVVDSQLMKQVGKMSIWATLVAWIKARLPQKDVPVVIGQVVDDPRQRPFGNKPAEDRRRDQGEHPPVRQQQNPPRQNESRGQNGSGNGGEYRPPRPSPVANNQSKNPVPSGAGD